jgi:hypothetical protein
MTRGVLALTMGLCGCSLLVDTSGLTSVDGAEDADVVPGPGDAGGDVQELAAGDAAAVADVDAPDAAEDRPPRIGDWPFDEGTGTVVGDVSGRGHHGTASGGQWVADALGMPKSALAIDGHVVTIAGSSDFDRPAAATVTYAAWMLRREALSHRLFVGVAYGDKDSSFGLEMLDDNTFVFFDGNEHVANATVSVPEDTWHHYAAVVDGEQVTLYLDGRAVGVGTADATPRAATAVHLGGSTWGDRLRGAIDRVRIYPLALTAAEVRSEMAR